MKKINTVIDCLTIPKSKVKKFWVLYDKTRDVGKENRYELLDYIASIKEGDFEKYNLDDYGLTLLIDSTRFPKVEIKKHLFYPNFFEKMYFKITGRRTKKWQWMFDDAEFCELLAEVFLKDLEQ